MQDILDAMKQATVVTNDNVRVRMEAAQIDALKARLKSEKAMNVFPNQFDVKKPYRVSIRFDQVHTNYGNFADLDAAKMVGNICGMAQFGMKALVSKLDIEAASKSPEYTAWMKDERNQSTIAKARLVYAAKTEA